MKEIRELLLDIIYAETLVKMVFGSKRKKSQPCKKVSVRPVIIKEQLFYQVEYTFDKNVTHKNMTAKEIVNEALMLLAENFKQLNIFTETEDIQILASKINDPRITRSCASRCKGDLHHNREKQYIIPEGRPCDFLVKLGVMTPDGKVVKRHYSKFRQINRFLEIVDDSFEYLEHSNASSDNRSVQKTEPEPLRIIDFGCGKSYLTFAIYYYLKILKGLNVEIIGLDLKADVIKFCNETAEALGYSELKFLMGDIADYTSDRADMVVTLHACDTATDYALINAVRWNTNVILSVPCCQHELFGQIKNTVNEPMLKHGIIKDKFTELLTDALRGLALEACGYDVSMMEFTSLEHTSKNIMIKAIASDPAKIKDGRSESRNNKASATCDRARRQYSALKEEYHVMPTIDRLFL